MRLSISVHITEKKNKQIQRSEEQKLLLFFYSSLFLSSHMVSIEIILETLRFYPFSGRIVQRARERALCIFTRTSVMRFFFSFSLLIVHLMIRTLLSRMSRGVADCATHRRDDSTRSRSSDVARASSCRRNSAPTLLTPA